MGHGLVELVRSFSHLRAYRLQGLRLGGFLLALRQLPLGRSVWCRLRALLMPRARSFHGQVAVVHCETTTGVTIAFVASLVASHTS